MASPATKPPGASTPVEVVLLPNLKNCLVNLPASLVSLLVNSNAIAQNVVVELAHRQTQPLGSDSRPSSTSQTFFLGWTGMQSQAKPAALVGKDSLRGGSSRQDHETPTVEIDATFGRLLGLSQGIKASLSLHIDPPLAHTVNIDPLTPTDWEIIELHANFLEMNFLSQVRALPNPAAGRSHPLVLHLTPTATANVSVTALTPTPGKTQPFAKIAPDAEVIVAPRTRQAARPSSARDNRSTASTSRRSGGGGRSTTSGGAVRSKSAQEAEKSRPPLFLRGVSRGLAKEWFEDDTSEETADEGLRVWLDRDYLHSKTLRGITWVAITVVKPAGLQEAVDPQVQSPPDQQPAAKIVAKVLPWDDAPDGQHVALSSLLCAALGGEDMVGGIVRIDPSPPPLPRTASALKEPSQQASKEAIVKRLRITPFIATEAEKKASTSGIKFGGETNADREVAVARIRAIYSKSHLLDGPLTDGMLLPAQDGWPGGILDFDPAPPGDPSKARTNWLIGSERKLDISLQPETPRPAPPLWPPGEKLPTALPDIVGVDTVIEQTRNSLLHSSSVLLAGGLGSGKTSLAVLLAHQLRSEYLFNILYFPCRELVTEETPIKKIKDTLHRLFASASWGARIGGRALVILDDLDKLCPMETELQVDANGKSRQTSEILCSLMREWCSRDSAVVLLATAQGKGDLNSLITGGHVVRDIIDLKAPSKDGRRGVLQKLVDNVQMTKMNGNLGTGIEHGSVVSEWMEGSDGSRPNSADGNVVETDLDLLDVAAHTDGYMPGDLALLVSRARSEALIRTISQDSVISDVKLGNDDFTAALKGFTPASLRGVTLHSSATTFASVGGLKETRQTLVETLQYPTTYAPLFAKCPLRLRSGLLLYGYPGCGKTLLASAVAGECGLNFISVKGPEILNKYIGASEKSVRDLFERAEAAKPSILFFDEFDAIAPKRGHDSTGVTDRVVNMLLTMMDGAEGLSGVYILAATSRPDLIDPALLRPGRLDKSLLCDMPDEQDRLDILRAISRKLKLDDAALDETSSKGLREVARRTEGYTGADLQAIMYNAHLDAIHDLLGSGNGQSPTFGKQPHRGEHHRHGHHGSKAQDFTYFRLDPTDKTNSGPPSAAAQAAERAQIAAKLAALQLARRKAKADRHTALHPHRPPSRPSSAAGQRPLAPNGISAEDHQRHDEPVIAWRHLARSLDETRSSISEQERARLARIYREFVVGRNGQMSDGQGGSAIGGRTSLM